jgi:hypothetical protein
MTLSSQAELEHTQQMIGELQRAIASAKRRLGNQPEMLDALLAIHRQQLDELYREVDEFLGFRDVPAAPVELGFQTVQGGSGTTSLTALEEVITDFRMAVTKIAEALATGTPREIGRPTAKLLRASDFQVVGVAGGSFKLLLEMPAQTAIEDQNIAERALDVIERTAAWVDDPSKPLPNEVADDVNMKRLVLREIQRLSPTEGSQITWVQIGRSRDAARTEVRLTPATYLRASSAVAEAEPEETVSLVGKLREIDLDSETCELRTGKTGRGRVRCKLPKELVAEAIAYVGTQRAVRVRGTVSKAKKVRTLKVVAIEPLPERPE